MAWLALTSGGCHDPSAPGAVTLAAAASLRNVVPALLDAHAREPGSLPVRVTYGASGSLRRQVEAGAPVAGVLFANSAPVDHLVARGLARAASRREVATNQLVLIAPRARHAPSPSLTFGTLGTLGPDQKLAIGDPRAVPAGAYAHEALQRLGSWDGLRDQLVFGGDVTMVLAYARRAEVAAAIVYRTDIVGVDDVVVLDRAEGAWAPVPRVVVALTGEGAESEAAARFLDFVASPRGQAILAEHGFGPP